MGDLMNNLIETYINKLTKQDILNFASKNNLKVTDEELDFVYNFIKYNYKTVLNNPNSFNLSNYKNNFSSENYNFINSLISKYIKFIK